MFQEGIGSRERRLTPFADSRLSWIAKFIGEDTVLKTIIEAETEFAKKESEDSWQAFVEQDKKHPLLQKLYWGLDKIFE
jgi:hypothetical protein